MIDVILDRILPQFCSVCGDEGFVLCEKCIDTIDVSGVFLCPDCDRPSPGGDVHAGCESSLDNVVAVVSYAKPVAQHMVRLCKYQYIELMGEKMGKMCESIVRFVPDVSDEVVVVPVPLHKKRFASRGFNQAELMGNIVADMLGVTCEQLLVRSRATARQVDMVGEARRENVVDAFSVIKKPPRRVVLVDDVATSCATLSSCADVLRAAGCDYVSAVVFARG